jgi:hypothetical protein
MEGAHWKATSGFSMLFWKNYASLIIGPGASTFTCIRHPYRRCNPLIHVFWAALEAFEKVGYTIAP